MKRSIVTVTAVGAMLVLAATVAIVTSAPGHANSGPVSAATAKTIVNVEPMPTSILSAGAPAITQEINNRVAVWREAIGADSMSTQELVATMDMLSGAISNRTDSPDWWLTVRELGTRRGLLCGMLPTDNPYRGGEYCL